MRWKLAKDRFWNNVRKTEQCWEWIGGLSGITGYGSFQDGKKMSAHRYSWILHNGEIPRGLCVLHSCDNRVCVRPDHLWLGTKEENSIDMARKGRNKPPAGAKLTGKNVLEIRSSQENRFDLANKFGVHPSLIWKVRKREVWKHVL